MGIRNCEFCKAYVADFEVHYCRSFGNQHRQSSATLPRSSSGDGAQDIDLRAQQTRDEEWSPTMNQTHSSWQYGILPNMHQRTGREETAAAEVPSPYGIKKQNKYNPATSDFLLPDWPHDQENQSRSTHFLQPSETDNVIIIKIHSVVNPGIQNSPPNVSLPVAEACVLPGFQQTFGHKNPLMNQMAHHPNASSQIECPGIFHTDETSPDFISDFNENENASTNPISQYYEASLSIPILAVQNAQYNPMDPIPQTNSIGLIHSNKCPNELY
ncbi:hypothetical protein CEXT_400831 [Caerostris extrusa]|uniref:Uncharacterized protein n=1 Tax=Caerostris extrusa TaxID=172846 RepID=A0AAV4MTJ8_CAEEX|nr:hypothetical protein CEXT_400831 [Caerostris extrusa]